MVHRVSRENSVWTGLTEGNLNRQWMGVSHWHHLCLPHSLFHSRSDNVRPCNSGMRIYFFSISFRMKSPWILRLCLRQASASKHERKCLCCSSLWQKDGRSPYWHHTLVFNLCLIVQSVVAREMSQIIKLHHKIHHLGSRYIYLDTYTYPPAPYP